MSDDEGPPTLEGPYPLANDFNYFLETATPFTAGGQHPVEAAVVVSAPRPRKVPTITKMLDPSDFNGTDYTCLHAAEVGSGRFKAFRFLGRFMLNLNFGATYPEESLKAIFAMCLAYAAKGAEALNIVADHFIFLLTSKHLDYEIAAHFKNKIDNTAAESILTRFEIVDQSNKSKERPSLCSDSFLIDITAIESSVKRKKLAGKGRHKEFNISYSIHPGATFELTNNDNFCLFRAFEFLRMKVVLPQQLFSEYKRTASWQLNDVRVLCRACNINLLQPFYSVEEYGEIIQAFYNQLHPGMFRLYCFEESGKMKPSWKSDVEDYQHELCVLFTEGDDGAAGHYDPIKALGKLFNAKGNYCFGCEMPFHQQTRHNACCKWKCHNCQRVGNLFRGNCDNKNGTFFETCLACNKTFKCAECYDHHAKVVTRKVKRGKETTTIKNSICKNSKKCIECGVIYHAWAQDKQKGHVCGQKFCRTCLGFHAPRDCYIPYLPKAKKGKRLIFFDFECTTDFKPDPEILRFKHHVNFCYAHVICTRCIEKEVWDQELDRACAICGPLRFYSWAPFHYDNTDVDRHFRVDDPLAAFTKWLLNFEAKVLGIAPGERRRRKRTKGPCGKRD